MPVIPIDQQQPLPTELIDVCAAWDIIFRPLQEKDRFVLIFAEDRLQLKDRKYAQRNALCVNFLEGKAWYRLRFARGKEAVVRAVGIRKGERPSVLDATAGLGRDAFVLAASGCRVYMVERSPRIALLVFDALRRARQDPAIGAWVDERLSIACQDSCDMLSSLPFSLDVIYLDPMFPERKKSARVKKDMQILQELIGPDQDADLLLKKSLSAADKRVVVKRPSAADPLAELPPDTAVRTRKHRFDIFISKPPSRRDVRG
ncbi:MAG: class I SAM-dependent methyltransferase [Candidatus Omnitrophota bacterium]